MDAFFTIAAPVPAEEPQTSTQEFDLVDRESYTRSTSSHSSCVIA